MKPRSILIVCSVMITLFACQAVALNIPTDGLVAYYSFDDGTATDNSGNGFDGTINGATVTDGVSSTSALHFDFMNTVSLSPLFSTNPNPAQVTLSAFVNLSENRPECIIAVGNPDLNIAHDRTGLVSIGVKLGETWYGVESSSPINLHEWTLLTGIVNRDTHEVKIYVNGNLVGTSPIPDTGYAHPGLTPLIGGHPWSGMYTIGDIDEVTIYQRALTDSEILQIYNAGINNPPIAQDDTYNVNQGDILTVPSLGVLANDNDPEGDPLTASIVSLPINGDLSLNSDGSFTYTPLPEWYGNVTFTYKANDGIADSKEAQVWITVNKTPVPTQYVINATNSTGGTISPSGEIPVSSGGSQVFNLLADKKYKPASITIDDITIDLKNLVVTFNNVFSDHTISAEYTSPSNKQPK